MTLPYTQSGIAGLIESTLTVFCYDGAGYSESGISGVVVDAPGKTVSFATTHFSTFVIAGAPQDSDGDGIDDSWETQWFGDLDTANATSDYDGDGLPDLTEFEYRGLGLNPTEHDEPLPAVGTLGAVVLSALLIALGSHRRKP